MICSRTASCDSENLLGVKRVSERRVQPLYVSCDKQSIFGRANVTIEMGFLYGVVNRDQFVSMNTFSKLVRDLWFS